MRSKLGHACGALRASSIEVSMRWDVSTKWPGPVQQLGWIKIAENVGPQKIIGPGISNIRVGPPN